MEMCNCSRKNYSKPYYTYSGECDGEYREFSRTDEADVISDIDEYTCSDVTMHCHCKKCGADKSNTYTTSEFIEKCMEWDNADI